jgi:hypothetical protein
MRPCNQAAAVPARAQTVLTAQLLLAEREGQEKLQPYSPIIASTAAVVAAESVLAGLQEQAALAVAAKEALQR